MKMSKAFKSNDHNEGNNFYKQKSICFTEAFLCLYVYKEALPFFSSMVM